MGTNDYFQVTNSQLPDTMLAVMWMMRVMSFQVQGPDMDCNAKVRPELLEVLGILNSLLPSLWLQGEYRHLLDLL